jgi:exopolyphosphatase / guanosine-5'-triphosphate,3'-diphosphate pyrophosphatase
MIKLILFSFFWTFFAIANECMDTRAVFEIGSVNTKVKVAKFNTCTNRIEVINYQDIIKFSLNEKLSEEKQKIGIAQILDFKKKAAEFNPSIYVGVASPLLADIPNGKSFIEKIKKECLIDFSIIDLKIQAYLGLAAVIHDSGLAPENLAVWDIGGSQMRIISKNKEGGYLTYLENKASVEFKNQVIREIKKQNPKKHLSPNPVGVHNFKLALALARKWAKGVNPPLRKKLIAPKVRVIGIGGVHYSSVRPLTNPRSLKYTKAEVLAAIKKNLNKSDKNLQGEFRESQISNLILVLGYMEELNLDYIETSKVDLTEGLLINPYLKF